MGTLIKFLYTANCRVSNMKGGIHFQLTLVLYGPVPVSAAWSLTSTGVHRLSISGSKTGCNHYLANSLLFKGSLFPFVSGLQSSLNGILN